MANVRKRISELTALTSASLDTTLVGVDGGTTYKIELDTLADAVTSRVNILDRSRLSALESVTSSFETKGRSVISSSTQITSYGFISESVNITSLNSFTSSQSTLNTAFTNGISSRLTTSSFDTFSQSVDSRIIAATNEQSFNGLISSSVQISDFGFISSSHTDITSLNSFTSSQSSLNTAFTNGISARLQTSSFNDYTTSVNTSISNLNTFTSSVSTASLVTSISNLNIFTASQSTSSLVNRLNSIESVSGSWITESETGSFLTSLNGAISSSAQITTFGFVSGSYETTGRGIISSSANLVTTSSFNSYTASISTASLVTSISNLNSATSSYLTSLNGAISSSSQLTSSFDTRYVASGSISAVPAGTISGSSQLTSSYDTRYVLSGSVSATGIINTNFIKYTRSSQQTSLSNGSVIVCNVLENSSGNVISPNTSTGQITLTAGKTYRLKGMVPGFTTNAGNTRPQFCWYNETTAAYIGSSAEAYTPGDAANFGSFGGAAEAIITPNVTTIVSFRLLAGAAGVAAIGGNGDFSTTGSYPWIDIEEITSTFALNTINTMQISGSLTTTGSITSLGGITGSIAATNGVISGSSQLTSSFDTRYAISASFVSSSNLSSIRTITSASYAALTPVSGTLYIIIG